jgi:hypothetical protein
MKKFIILGLLLSLIAVSMSVSVYKKYLPISKQTPQQIAFEVCGHCSNLEWPARIILERPDGVVVLAIPYVRAESIFVIDTKRKTITDETAIGPFIVINQNVVTAGISQDMSQLRVLTATSTTFCVLPGSKLLPTETYETGLYGESNVQLSATTSSNSLLIDVYQRDNTHISKPVLVTPLYQKKFDL